MIQYFKTFDGEVKQLDGPEDRCWINIFNSNREEVLQFSYKHDIPEEFVLYPLDRNERARIEIDEGCVSIILRIPIRLDQEADIPFGTGTLGIIIKDDLFVTISSSENSIIKRFIDNNVKNFDTDDRTRFLLSLFYYNSAKFLIYLKEINNMTNKIEKELHKSMKNEELINLLNIEKSLVYFTTSLKENEIMMERYQRIQLYSLDEEEEEFLEDVIIENKQAIEMANIHSNILSGMMDAFASVISNNLNVVMKFLTSVTIILMLPTLVASIYGMNIDLPFQDSPYAFEITMGFSLILSFVGILVFLKRDMF